MSKFFGFVFAACLLAIGASTSVPAAGPDWPKSLTISSASPGGVFYIYGELLAQMLTQKLGISVNSMPTGGSVHNIKLVEDGSMPVGIITMGVGLQGWNGSGDWTQGKKFRQMRALFPAYDSPFQFVALRQSGLIRLIDLDGKRVGVGPKAGAGALYAPEILKALGVSAQYISGSWEANVADVLAGNCAALLGFAGVPLPAIQQIEAKEPVTFLSLSADEVGQVRKAIPEITPSKIPGGAYKGLTADQNTIGIFIFVIGRADLSDDFVYHLVKAVYENQRDLVRSLPVFAETVVQNVDKDTFLPLHPGAIRYYREIGIKIPESLVPTD
jgi:TRAP transporter TAXI family solute receptor